MDVALALLRTDIKRVTSLLFIRNNYSVIFFVELFKDKDYLSKTIKSDMLQTNSLTYYLRLQKVIARYFANTSHFGFKSSEYCSVRY